MKLTFGTVKYLSPAPPLATTSSRALVGLRNSTAVRALSSAMRIEASRVFGDVRAAFHMIDEGSQLWRDLPTPGIVEKHAGRHWHEPLQHLHEPSGFQRAGGDRLRHLAETQTFDSRTKQGGEIARDER